MWAVTVWDEPSGACTVTVSWECRSPTRLLHAPCTIFRKLVRKRELEIVCPCIEKYGVDQFLDLQRRPDLAPGKWERVVQITFMLHGLLAP